jgi:uncharacterized protein
MYKLSKYNFLIDLEKDGKFLLYNTLNQGLYELGNEQGNIVGEWEQAAQLLGEQELEGLESGFRKLLLDGGFVVPSDLDELGVFNERRRLHLETDRLSGVFNFTITPTISCNMGCAYCFEGEKPIRGKMDNATADHIVAFVKREIANPTFAPKIRGISVTWYGGEPLLGSDILDTLSGQLIAVAEAHQLSYSASIITNGVLLSPKNWEILQRNRVTFVQTTLDGYQETHNESRPLKAQRKESYDTIVRNLTYKPKGITVTIRINCDKKIAAVLGDLLNDLYAKRIWPHQGREIKLNLAKKRAHHNIDLGDHDRNVFFTDEEFHQTDDAFMKMRFEMAKRWALESGKKIPKLKFKLPTTNYAFCKTANSPLAITIDQYGNVSKCWEFINDATKNIQKITEDYAKIKESPLYQQFITYNPVDYDAECKQCAVLPICDRQCPVTYTHNTTKKMCGYWKFNLKESFKRQYLMMLEDPESIDAIG